jgi:NlpC/P60 family putative phage cell wall peptidase
MISRDAIVAEARSWCGTPWLHQACVKFVGCDCIGLVCGVADALGIPEAKAWRADSEFRGYGRTPVPSKLLAACDRYLDHIPTSTALPGDVLLFTFLREPMHFAIKSGPDMMIHGFERVGHVCENGIGVKWQRRMLGAYRYRGVA